MHGKHTDRVAEQLRTELAELIENELADPRIGSLTVTGVRLSPDGKEVQVRVCPVGPELPAAATAARPPSRRETEAADQALLRNLDHARHFLRRELAARLQMRFTPELRFSIDRGPQHAQRVQNLLDRIKSRQP